MMDRTEAWNLLCEFTQSDSLRKHALAVEACLRAYAEKLGGDKDTWSVVGLLHDFDYERYPQAPDPPLEGPRRHCKKRFPPAMSWPASSPPSAWCAPTRAWRKWKFSR